MNFKNKIALLMILLSLILTLPSCKEETEEVIDVTVVEDGFYGDYRPEIAIEESISEYEYRPSLVTVNSVDEVYALRNFDGFILNAKAEKEIEGYKLADEVLELLKHMKIEYPIFLDVEDLMNSEISNYQKKGIISKFIERLHENRCIVGLSGSTETLKSLQENFINVLYLSTDREFTNSDVYADIYYDGSKYNSIVNYQKLIRSNNLNNPSNFIDNIIHKVELGDTVWDIAEMYGSSMEYIADYNNLTDRDKIWPDDVLIIPVTNSSKKDINIPEHVSAGYLQDSRTTYRINNYNAESRNMSFGINLMCNFKDEVLDNEEQFLRIIRDFARLNNECIEAGVKTGGYYITGALTEARAEQEALYIVELLKNYRLDNIIMIDIEPPHLNNLLRLGYSEAKGILDTHVRILKESGYTPLIKCSEYGAMQLDAIGAVWDKEFAITKFTYFDQGVSNQLLYTGDVGMIIDSHERFLYGNNSGGDIFAIKDYSKELSEPKVFIRD